MAVLLGASSVMIGAGLKHIGADGQMEVLQTALKYHQLYSLVLLALGLYCLNKTRSWKLVLPPALFTLGIIVFSGSLYAMNLLGISGLGNLTPVGGILLMAGWFSLIFLPRH